MGRVNRMYTTATEKTRGLRCKLLIESQIGGTGVPKVASALVNSLVLKLSIGGDNYQQVFLLLVCHHTHI